LSPAGSNASALPRGIALPARAKLNLDLAIVGRRPDGMHELRSRMQAVDLHDLLEVEAADKTELEVTGLALHGVAVNSVLKAQAALEAAAGRKLPARFRLNKRIPPGSGLGGASSDAAVALRALAAIHGVAGDLGPAAQAAGADVSFFLKGGTALVESVGEQVTPIAGEPSWFAIAWPGVELSTADVYRAWDEVQGDGPNELRRAAGRVDPRVEEFAIRLGPGWRMTGSGSAFFKVCADRDSAMAATDKLGCWTVVSRSV
jgi:4-diphosphocytidyl-2-C-methyl-D-erythritol kinase